MKLTLFLSTLCAAGLSSQAAVTVYTTVRLFNTVSTKGQIATPSPLFTSYVLTNIKSGPTTLATSKATVPTTAKTSVPTTAKTTAPTTAKVTTPLPLTTTKPTTPSTTKVVTPVTTASTAASYASTGIFYHNLHRSNHSAPALVWNATQATIAAQIASSCVFAHNTAAGGGGYGQNLAVYGATGNVQALDPNVLLAKAITNGWYNSEAASFLPSYYGQPTPDISTLSKWGHFTQVVWKGSSSVGCASQFCPIGTIYPTFASWFTVCNYVPPGNVVGHFDTNVGLPLGHPTVVV